MACHQGTVGRLLLKHGEYLRSIRRLPEWPRGFGEREAFDVVHAVLEKSGRELTAGELAREYGFIDVDGRQPAPFGPTDR